jgi:hypothetical protein
MNTYSLPNTTEREHLTALVKRLTDDELSRPLEAGWTVAGMLAHLAFWDQRALCLLEKWKKAGVSPSPVEVDIVNDAIRPLCAALAPRAAAELAVSSAQAIDAAIDGLEPGLLAEVEAKGSAVRLNRALHRRDHLEQIERTLGI